MYAKSALLFVAQACLIQSIYSQYIGAPFAGPQYARAAAAAPCADYPGYLPSSLSAANGGAFAVTSASSIAPTGVFVTSENAYEGGVAVGGKLPFLSAVALEGTLPTLGAGVIAYGCGNGNVAILNEDIAPAYNPGPVGYGAPGLGYPGCGYLY